MDNHPQPKAGTRPLRILCAEDNVLLGDVMLCLLARAGHWVEHAEDGMKAWEKMSDDLAAFDVLVTDHQMPFMDGLRLVGQLRRANYRGRIVVHSSGLLESQAADYRALGVDSIVVKAARADELLCAVQESNKSS